jgi:hypothetical protein
MNTGIGDAVNLAWKLAAVLKGTADARLLDTYEPERIEFARRLVATTDRVFTLATAQGPLADLVRTRLVPQVVPRALAFGAVREFLFRTVSQIMVNYRGRALSVGAVGSVHGGDRLPWVSVAGADNYAPLRALLWQVQVYGEAHEELARWCEGHDVPLERFAFCPEHQAAGLTRDALYLLRPDGYLALTASAQDPQLLARYFAERGLRQGDDAFKEHPCRPAVRG